MHASLREARTFGQLRFARLVACFMHYLEDLLHAHALLYLMPFTLVDSVAAHYNPWELFGLAW
jgi:hypothetical protein